VAFAVAAAADLAVAFALRPIVSEVAGISPHDLYHCNPELRLCRSGWSYRPALEMLQQRTKLGSLRTPGCLPYRPDPREQEDQQDLCAPPDRSRCRDAPTALQGRFQFFPLNDVVQVQRHIRNHGGVLTRLQVYPDLKPFFNATPKGIYTRSAAAAKPGSSSSSKGDAIEHAVVVVGYDNDGAFWVMRNSWGDGFAEGGYFRVSGGTLGPPHIRGRVAAVVVLVCYGMVWAAEGLQGTPPANCHTHNPAHVPGLT
jgi:hypothetical protein